MIILNLENTSITLAVWLYETAPTTARSFLSAGASITWKCWTKSKKHPYFTYSPEEISSETISRMKYRFGSNEMYIGKGIIRLLEFLEKRYGIDFSKVNQQESKNLSSYKARMIIAIIRAIILAIGSIFRYEWQRSFCPCHIWTQEMIQFLSPVFRINKPFLQAPARNNPRYEACFDLIRGDFCRLRKSYRLDLRGYRLDYWCYRLDHRSYRLDLWKLSFRFWGAIV